MQITPHLNNILQVISEYPTVSIVASTGSGKSIAIPAAIASNNIRCFVVVPTRTAAISLMEYQRVIQRNLDPNVDVNKLVGYAAEGQVNYSPDTLIAYVTGGHMRRKLLSHFNNGQASPIDFCDVLMVDEVHVRDINADVTIDLWMEASRAGVTIPRLVVASATPSPIYIYPEPHVYEVIVDAYPIEFKYYSTNIDIEDSNNKLYVECARYVTALHKDTPLDSGHILVFGPGASEVELMTAALKQSIKDNSADIIPAFGALKQEDISKIYKETKERKIIVATNIAEMALTIDGIGHVVDTMTEKRAETALSGGFRLALHYISKASATQRAGRTGRTRPGVCHRMCTLDKYESLEDHRPPEIDRVPIYDLVMELLDAGLSPISTLVGVSHQRITDSIYLLTKLDMVVNVNNVVTVTDSGHFAPNFPLSVRNAAFLWKWISAGYPVFPGVVIACIIDCYGPSYFWIPRREHNQSIADYNNTTKEYKNTHFTKYIGYNDLETALNLWSDLTNTFQGIHPKPKQFNLWSKNNSLNAKKIRELLQIVDLSIKALKRLHIEVQLGPFTTEGAMTAARPLLLSTYSDMTLIQKRDNTYFSPITKFEYRLDNRDAVNTFTDNPPIGIIALVSAEIKGQRGVFRVVSFAVDTENDGLGRPIIIRSRPRTRGVGPRTITKTPDSSISDALGLLASLNDPTTAPVDSITDALQSLSELSIDTPKVDEPSSIEEEVEIPSVDASNYNPPLVIEDINYNDKTFNLIQDAYLPVGTKQRGLGYFLALKDAGYTDIVTYATPYGYGQVATAWCCLIAGLNCSIFLQKAVPQTKMTKMAIGLGAMMYEIGDGTAAGYVKNSVIGEYAKNHAADIPTAMFINLGLDDPTYIQFLAAAIQEAGVGIQPTNIWLAGGSAVIARAIAMAFPGVHLNIVQVGRQIYDDVLTGINYTLYKAPESFTTDATLQPPYESLSNYDAKVWQFVSQDGQTGDYIWNVK